jgi:hypothetical protein
MDTITEDSIIVRTDDLAVTDLDGETVVLDVESGQYFGLNAVGTHVFKMAEEPVPVTAVVDTLRETYEVPADQIRQDILLFLANMQAHGLITIADAEAA